ncbi:Predicted hydrolase of the alpha/beta superfamily [Zhouia amylolytica]|uniref:Predicted hydrolase of the alpha/beta superfamily n=1 Tax=Zhouia amylolytica TaxID=376730 RepID=A0A1I6TWH6_9FLAO|nr:alpha/beta hydrolase-fold protein [Zhouia amylolytica]SFS93504.1 Predicted hydrolase of the alpha/beta superfamily [Zhouia amylolytica]
MKKVCFILFLLLTFNQVVSQSTKEGTLFNHSIVLKSDVLQEEREIQIFLPADYEKNSNKYPVLYVLDGQRYFLNGIVFQQNLVWQEMAPEFIVVGINTDPVKRRNLFYKESSKFIQFMEEELIPKINTRFNTLDERIYFGWEMAAGLGIQIFAQKPHLFNGFLLSSPTHISKDRLEMAGKMLKSAPKDDIQLYATLGTVENWAAASMASLDSIFQKYPVKNILWEYNLSDNENHYTTPLTTINEGLKLFFSDYGPLRFYSVQEFKDFGGIDSLKKHYQTRGEKYHISDEIHSDTKHYLLLQALKENNFILFDELMTEIDGKTFIKNYYRQARWFNRFSGFYTDNNRFTDALEIIESGLHKFPNASILHFAKGNYYRIKGDFKESRKWYEQAIQIARMNNEPELEKYVSEIKKYNKD